MTTPSLHHWLSSAMTVNELLQRHPHTLPTLHALGVHTCCGGGLPLSEAASKAGISEELLLHRVTAAIAAEAER